MACGQTNSMNSGRRKNSSRWGNMEMKYIDMHCDTIPRLCLPEMEARGETLRRNRGHLDLERMKQGNAMTQCFAIYTNLKAQPDAYAYARRVLARFKKEMEENKDMISQVLTAEDILRNDKEGKMSALLTIEEGAVCQGSLERLREFYEEGVRMMTLTWNYPNDLAWPNRVNLQTGETEPETGHGLTETGFAFIEEMERLGMLIDVSHLGDAGFWDIVKHTKRPFMASHSNARSEASHVRNLTDDMIRALAERGGVMGINFCSAFLNDSNRSAEDGGVSRTADMVRHMKHIRRIGGIECIGLGSDFDGISGKLEVDSPAALYQIADEMSRQGFTGSEIDAVFYGNVLRVFTEILH